MADEVLRRLERVHAQTGSRTDRDRLIHEGLRTRRGPGWAIRVMGGPGFDDLLWWHSPVSLLWHLANNRGDTDLFCAQPTWGPRGGPWRRRMHPLFLQWRTQDQVGVHACRGCMREALRRAHVDHRHSLFPREPLVDRTRIAGWLGRYQAAQWGRWHPAEWPLWIPGLP